LVRSLSINKIFAVAMEFRPLKISGSPERIFLPTALAYLARL